VKAQYLFLAALYYCNEEDMVRVQKEFEDFSRYSILCHLHLFHGAIEIMYT
jgi:hypothetical protein